MPRYEDILELFKDHGQDHVLAGWDKLFLDQQDELLQDCGRVDFAWLKSRWEEFETTQAFDVQKVSGLGAPAIVPLPEEEKDLRANNEARELGEETLRAGKVAALLVAGGLGTRLGFNGPKGCFPIGPLSGRSLFQWFGEQILARSRRYGAAIPWYIMTSDDNDRDIRLFFEERNFFGLRKRDVYFFKQAMVPVLDFNGKLLLSTPSSLAMNPNGHGGALLGLKKAGILQDMKKRGVEYVSYFQVDNPLARIADPLFLGWHIKSESEMSTKVVEKSSPTERIGVPCIRNGKPAIVEYRDLDDDEARAEGSDGRLKLWAGSIGIHMMNIDFIERVSATATHFPWHQSRRKVRYFSSNRLVKPERENAARFETFIFDALPSAKKTLNLEIRREEEFAPLKNAEGSDSIDSCRTLLSNHFCDWLTRDGVSVAMPGMGGSDAARPVVEISPLYALDAEELAEKIRPEGVKLERVLLLG